MKSEKRKVKSEKIAGAVTVKPPSKIFATIMLPIVRLYLWLTLKIKKTDNLGGLKGPFVVLCNHQAPLDIFMMYSALYPRTISTLTAHDILTWGALRPFTPLLGLIPKNQNAMDLNAIRLLKNIVLRGGNVCIYPEGKMSLDGTGLHHIGPAIVKLLKFLDVPVVMHTVKGLFNASSRINMHKSRGRVYQSLDILFTKEDLKTLSADEVYRKTVEALTFNDCLFQKRNNLHYKSRRPAKGLDMVLYMCPKCGELYTIYTTKTHIKCSACGNSVRVIDYGDFVADAGSVTPERLDLWYAMQRKSVRDAVSCTGFCINNPVEAYVMEDKKYRKMGEGELIIDDENIRYVGTRDGAEVAMSFPLKTRVTIMMHEIGTVDFTEGADVLRFHFKDNKHAAQYGLIVEEKFRYLNGLDN